jgi:5-methyltetrahydrofolate--homocysteine methyltransferase
MLPLVEAMAAATALPIIVQPNAGLPRLEDGRTVFPGHRRRDGLFAARFVEAGASLVGSCCGSSPRSPAPSSTSRRSCRCVEGRDRAARRRARGSAQDACRIGAGAPVAVIGERINPTGKPELAESLRAGSMSVVRAYAVEQEHAGASALDVNVGAAGVDAPEALRAAVLALSGGSDLPLVLDNDRSRRARAGAARLPGPCPHQLGERRRRLDRLDTAASLPATALPWWRSRSTTRASPETSSRPLAIVERIRARAHAAGLRERRPARRHARDDRRDRRRRAAHHVEAIAGGARELGLATLLGVSNVSHGLPDRPELNAAFIASRVAGLDAAIVNPADEVVRDRRRAREHRRACSRHELDAHGDAWAAWDAAYAAALERAAGGESGRVSRSHTAEDTPQRTPSGSPRRAASRGDADGAPASSTRSSRAAPRPTGSSARCSRPRSSDWATRSAGERRSCHSSW